MEVVVAERWFDPPIDFEDFRGIRARGAWCFDVYDLRYLGSYFSADGRRMLCRYEAPDAEAVREPSRKLGVPFERIWSATVYKRPPPDEADSPPEPPDDDAPLIVVERSFPEPQSFEELAGGRRRREVVLRYARCPVREQPLFARRASPDLYLQRARCGDGPPYTTPDRISLRPGLDRPVLRTRDLTAGRPVLTSSRLRGRRALALRTP